MNTKIYKKNYEEIQNKQEKKIRISKNPEDRKQEIIDAALKLFAQNGYSNTTIQDIANRIGVSQGLCYRYFKSKSEIFEAASERYAFSAVEKLKIPFEEKMTSIQKLDFLLREMYEYIIKSSEFNTIYFSEGKEKINTEVQLGKLKNFTFQLTAILADIMKQGVEENIISCTNIEYTSFFLANAMVYAFHNNTNKETATIYASKFILTLRDLLIHSLQIDRKDTLNNEWLDKLNNESQH